MSLLLKIVEGPNKGAEIALVDGVAVTVGKTDDCDIVLADQTLPDAPMRIEAGAGGATLDGESMEPLHVISRGSTSFAIGPSDSAWGELVWREDAAESGEKAEDGGAEDARREEAPPSVSASAPEERPAPRRRGCLGCLLWLLVLLLILLGLAWFFRAALRPKAEELWGRMTGAEGAPQSQKAPSHREGAAPAASPSESAMSSVVGKYALSVTNKNGREVFVGDFKTRAERLAATAEAYAAKPGVEIDFADCESLRTAVDDTLALVGETRLSVSAVTSRVAVIHGVALDIVRAVQAIAADVPKIANVDLSGVEIARAAIPAPTTSAAKPAPALPVKAEKPVVRTADVVKTIREAKHTTPLRVEAPPPSLPVCGILATPYPCLVLNDGKRILEGAPVGDWTVVKIGVDSVVITNATGRFVWKP